MLLELFFNLVKQDKGQDTFFTLKKFSSSLQTYIIYKSQIYIFPSFRACGVWCDSVDVDSKLELEENTISAEYTLKLVNDNCVVLDPVSLTHGWLKERVDKKGDGILQWPSTVYLDIANFIG